MGLGSDIIQESYFERDQEMENIDSRSLDNFSPNDDIYDFWTSNNSEPKRIKDLNTDHLNRLLSYIEKSNLKQDTKIFKRYFIENELRLRKLEKEIKDLKEKIKGDE